MDSLLQILLREQYDKFDRIRDTVQRTSRFPDILNKIKVAMGMRRVGKTFFLLQTIQRLIDQGVPRERILYLNFEDDRLLPCSQEKLRELLESFYQIYPENHDELCYLFLDEIQNVEGWSLVIRRFFDTKKVQIYLSGSSAKLLSKEIATELRGRSIAIEIWPFSFNEYLLANPILLEGKLLGQREKDILLKALLNYLNEGGFPEIVLLSNLDRRQVLQDYVELVIMRDIIERHHVKNISVIKYMCQTLLKNVGCGFSVNKFFNDLKSQGLPATRNLLYEYLDYLEDAYLIFSVPLFSESLRKVNSNPKKMYAIDTGLVKAFSFSINKNNGHLFENLFFLDLKREGHKIYYYLTKEKYEIDFLVEDRLGNRKIYQVVWDTKNEETLRREMRALKAAEQELNIPGELVTPETYMQKIWQAIQS